MAPTGDEGEEKSYRVSGYASTFDEYTLFSYDGIDYKEKIDRNAFNEADMTDVIFLYDHAGMVYARQKNGTLHLEVNDHGLKADADLSSTEASRGVYEAIRSGLVDQMSFAFTVREDSYDQETHTRTILKFNKIYDVSAVSIPANPSTSINAVAQRSAFFDGVIEKERAERLEREAEERKKALTAQLEERKMNIENMNLEEVNARLLELETEERDGKTAEELEAMTSEVSALMERKTVLEDLEQRKKDAEALNKGEAKGKVKETRKEEKKMTVEEIRASREYQLAFLRGVKNDDYSECRKLMTTDATVASGDTVSSNTVPVPTFLETEIKNAWEEHAIASLCSKSYQSGNIKVVFEVSATGAVIHVEGAAAPTEEKVVLGSVELKAQSIKKWITVSDEALENTTVDTVGYLYKEIAYKIVEKAEEVIIGDITGAQASTDATHPGVPALSKNPAVETILEAEALLSGSARDLHIAMNRQTKAAFKKLVLSAGYAIDIFDGLEDKIVYTDKLPAYSSASATDVYMIIGDFGYGYRLNFPNGNDVTIKRDDLSLAELDLVKLVGRQYVGHGVIAPKAFVNVKKVAEG